MSRRTRLYVSGPITGSGDWKQNMRILQRVGMELRRQGYAPFVPAVGPASAMGRGLTHEDWLEVDLPFVQVCDAVLRLPGESPGADEEVAYAESLAIPVYYSTEELLKNESPTRAGDVRFENELLSLGRLHEMKSRDYGSETDPYANVRGSQEFGVAPWVGALVRGTDKVKRLQQFAKRGVLANESAEDSMRDLAVYAIIAYLLYQEESGEGGN